MRMRWVGVWVVVVCFMLECILWYLESIDEDGAMIRKREKRSGTTFLCVVG